MRKIFDKGQMKLVDYSPRESTSPSYPAPPSAPHSGASTPEALGNATADLAA